MAGIGLLNTEWDELNPATEIPDNGVLPNSPEENYNLSIEYTFHWGLPGEFMARADWNYTGEQYFQAKNQPGDFQPSYDVLDLRFSYRSADERYTLALYGLNVMDEEYFIHLSDATAAIGMTTAVPAPPAEWGLEAMFRF